MTARRLSSNDRSSRVLAPASQTSFLFRGGDEQRTRHLAVGADYWSVFGVVLVTEDGRFSDERGMSLAPWLPCCKATRGD
jgi:hypothetical protein